MPNRPRRAVVLALTLVGVLLAVASCGNVEIPFQHGDHVVFIGNALADRMQHDGWLEAYLQSELPELKLVIRNQGFAGDRIDHRPRVKGTSPPRAPAGPGFPERRRVSGVLSGRRHRCNVRLQRIVRRRAGAVCCRLDRVDRSHSSAELFRWWSAAHRAAFSYCARGFARSESA